MAYKDVVTLSEWSTRLSRARSRITAMEAIIRSAQKVESVTGTIEGTDWPVDAIMDGVLVDSTTFAGPLQTLDTALDADLAASFRYKYTIKPTRPSTFTNGYLVPHSYDASPTMTIMANTGTPFSKVVVGDKIDISIPTAYGIALYENIEVLGLISGGLGIEVADLNHLINPGPSGNSAGWSLGSGWEYNAGTIRATVAALENLSQASGNMVYKTVKGMTYEVQVAVAGWASGTSLTPYLGSVAGTAINSTSYNLQYITCAEDNADLIFVPDGAVQCTLASFAIRPVYRNHVSNGTMCHNETLYNAWTYAAHWQYDAVNQWFEDDGNPIAANTELVQAVAAQAIPYVADTEYAVKFTVVVSAGTICPRIGASYGYPISASGTYTQYVRASTSTTHAALDLAFTSDGSFQGTIKDVEVWENVVDTNGDLEVSLSQSDE